jgi:hypothetical protein
LLDTTIDDGAGSFEAYSVGTYGTSGFIVKTNGGGEVWQREIADAVYKGVIVLGDYVYVCGQNTNSSTGIDGLVVKYDKSGNIIWQKSHSSLNSEVSTDSWNAIATNGVDIFLAGQFNWGGVAPGIFFRMDTDGNRVWASRTDEGSREIVGLDVDATNMYSITSEGVIWKMDLSSNMVAQRRIDGGLGALTGGGIHIADSSTILVSGWFEAVVGEHWGYAGELTSGLTETWSHTWNLSALAATTARVYDTRQLGTDYISGGWALDVATGKQTGEFKTFDSNGDPIVGDNSIHMGFWNNTPGSEEGINLFYSMDSDGTNFIMVGEFTDGVPVVDTQDAVLYINTDTRVSMTGNADAPLDTFEFFQPLSGRIYVPAHAYLTPTTAIQDLGTQIIEDTLSKTNTVGTVSVTSAGY